jgi:hypothetical protein
MKTLTTLIPETNQERKNLALKGRICLYRASAERENNLKPLSEKNPLYSCLNCNLGSYECENHITLRGGIA